MSAAECTLLGVVLVSNLATIAYSWRQVGNILSMTRALTAELMALKNPWVHEYATQSEARMKASMGSAQDGKERQEVYEDDQLA